MNLPQALAIVKDHIRIGKGMELTNGVPEALEMVVEELRATQKALELACGRLNHIYPLVTTGAWKKECLSQTKAGEK